MKAMCNLTLSTVLILASLCAMNAGSEPPSAVVDRYFEAYRTMQTADLSRLYSQDAIFVDVAQRHEVKGAEAIKDYIEQLTLVHSAMGIEEKRRMVSGNQVVIEYLYTGTVSGEALRKATGKDTCRDVSYAVPVTSWFEVQDGKIVLQKDYVDVATLAEVKAKASGATP